MVYKLNSFGTGNSIFRAVHAMPNEGCWGSPVILRGAVIWVTRQTLPPDRHVSGAGPLIALHDAAAGLVVESRVESQSTI